ncbi:MAG: hypothetical protein [Bacteriophage sp.]|nr:MAG: hypothetical protein [Bacteriophage sp.]
MKFQPNDVVRRVLPSGTMVGVLMIVIARVRGKRTVVKDVSTGECYIYKSSSLGMVGKTTKIMISESDMDRIDTMKGMGSFYHVVSPAYDKLYANPTNFVCFVSVQKDRTVRRTFYLGKISRVLRKVDETRKGYEMVPVKQPMYKLQLIGEL